MDVMAIPSAPISTDVVPTAFRSGPLRHIRSSTPIINRLTMLAPRALPAARSGWSTRRIELRPVPSSGKDVAVASRTTPTNDLPSPVLKRDDVGGLDQKVRYHEDGEGGSRKLKPQKANGHQDLLAPRRRQGWITAVGRSRPMGVRRVLYILSSSATVGETWDASAKLFALRSTLRLRAALRLCRLVKRGECPDAASGPGVRGLS